MPAHLSLNPMHACPAHVVGMIVLACLCDPDKAGVMEPFLSSAFGLPDHPAHPMTFLLHTAYAFDQRDVAIIFPGYPWVVLRGWREVDCTPPPARRAATL